jgi:hypothetical protein
MQHPPFLPRPARRIKGRGVALAKGPLSCAAARPALTFLRRTVTKRFSLEKSAPEPPPLHFL